MIEHDYDIPFIGELALREKQIQQNYRPLIAVHKWFARRPGTLFRGLLLAEFASDPLRSCFYNAHDLSGLVVGDPFMGGGSPLMEANRVGCDVVGYDINPMAYWIVKEEIEHLNLDDYRFEAARLRHHLAKELGSLYQTRCLLCGNAESWVKYFLWVKVLDCVHCGADVKLFPGYLVAADRRHPLNVIVCSHCGALTEHANRQTPGNCNECSAQIVIEGPAKRGKCACPECGEIEPIPQPSHGSAQAHTLCS